MGVVASYLLCILVVIDTLTDLVTNDYVTGGDLPSHFQRLASHVTILAVRNTNNCVFYDSSL
jgi:phage-related holin